jgi:hypothetical protein
MEFLKGHYGDEKCMMVGLISIKAICKKFEYEYSEERRAGLYDVLGTSIETIGDIVNTAIGQETESALNLLYLVCKVLYSANQIQLCPFMMQPGALEPWIQFLKAVLDKFIPRELTENTDIIEENIKKDKDLHWKLKGVAAKLSYRILAKYGQNYKSLKTPTNDTEAFTQHYVEDLAKMILDSHLALMFQKKKGFVGSIAL